MACEVKKRLVIEPLQTENKNSCVVHNNLLLIIFVKKKGKKLVFFVNF